MRKNYYIIMYKGEKVEPVSCAELYGDYNISTDMYVEKVIKNHWTQLTEYSFNAKKFRTLQAAQKALTTLIEGFTRDETKTLEHQGYVIKAIYVEE